VHGSPTIPSPTASGACRYVPLPHVHRAQGARSTAESPERRRLRQVDEQRRSRSDRDRGHVAPADRR
jgi:hypothetical protein